MFDCAADIWAYHDSEVTLGSTEQGEMRDRRNANRTRLKNGLKKNKKPAPREFKAQGSYAMRTMTQHTEKHYDIDDGVYFRKEDLVGPRGGEATALDARQMVRDAVDDGSFKRKPEVRNKCVRVYYEAGYHVDLPVYRTVTTTDFLGQEAVFHEHASTDWNRSDARDVTAWFEAENTRLSPDTQYGKQLRRITRLIKKYAKSRASWESSILGGFGITKLVTECFEGDASREDQSLYYTMKNIRDRLTVSLRVQHPVTGGETICEENDPRARVLKEKLTDAINWLSPLFDFDCTREKALDCWDKVYATTFFSERKGGSKAAASVFATSAAVKQITAAPAVQGAVQKHGGGRYARGA